MIITIAETTFFLRLPNMWSPIPNKRKILDESPSAGNSSRWSTSKRDGSGGPWSWETETRSHRGNSGRGMRGRQWFGGSVGRGVLEWFFLSTNSGEKLRVQIRQRIFFLHSAGQTNKCHYELCFWNECNWPAMAICKMWQLYHRIVVSKDSGTPCATMLLYSSGHCCELNSFPFSRVWLHVKNMAPWESLLQQLAESSVDWMGSLHFFGWNPKKSLATGSTSLGLGSWEGTCR